MITTIVFDIGNVLAHFGWKEYLQSCGYMEDILRRVSQATVESRMWKEWDRGCCEESDLIDLCLRENPDIRQELRAFFDQVPNMVEEYDYAPSLVKTLKDNGYQVYVLSNYSRWHFDLNKEHFKFFPYIDGGVVSYQVYHVKPEPEIYKALIEKYDINPEEAVFIDDILENTEGAKPFGFCTIWKQSYEQMIEELRKYGVTI